MGFIYSTDENIMRLMYEATKKKEPRIKRLFVTFKTNSRTKQPAGAITICANLAVKACVNNKVILAYDADKKELLVIPSIKGNINVVSSSKTYNTRYIAGLRFLLAAGFERDKLPVGRFEATLDADGVIHAYLDKPLPEDEQGRRNMRCKDENN